LAAIGGS